ncbi:MAG: deoxynucleoside kinase [Gammaproteobacteria bacterium]|nr:deoxynucleoside kinase [Gammaproteobacteria bacterium]
MNPVQQMEYEKLNNAKLPSYVAVEGPIGVGKTTLARQLADSFQGDLILEGAEDNPFLDKFYNDPKSVALPTQLYFLFQRIKQLQELRQSDLFSPCRIADYLMDKDRLFARVTLDDDELHLYEQVYANLTLDAPTPDLVVYLQAPVEVLYKRIKSRGRSNEQSISLEYLQKINDAYTYYFHYYDKSPLLIVNVSSIDIVSSKNDYKQLVERILNTQSGKHYFNPKPL